MSRRDLHLKIKEVKSDIGLLKGVEISVGRIFEETWEEPIGPTPFPSVAALRSWDLKLLNRYRPFYIPASDVCDLCTYGKCDLTGDKKGACGMRMSTQQSRIVLLAACMGASTHTSHGRHLVHYLLERFGRNAPIDVGGADVLVEAPVMRLVCGIRPAKLKDLEDALNYCEEQIVSLLAATHTGQEGNNLDYESKVFHAGMIDHLALEVADIAQISAFGFPKADPNAPLAELGLGVVDINKPVIMAVGHNVVPSVEIMDYLTKNKMREKVEICGLCCTAHDMTRYDRMAKVIGPISWQLRFVRTGIPDVLIIDEQCIRTDLFEEAEKLKIPVIATNEKNCQGLPDRTADSADKIVGDLVSGATPGVLLLDPEKVGEVASKTAIEVFPKRASYKKMPSLEKIKEEAKKCTACYECVRACPNLTDIPVAMKAAAAGNTKGLADILEVCLGCVRCESACPQDIPIHSLMIRATEEEKLRTERYKLRVGRGAIKDIEIRRVGAPIVLGEIPGVLAYVGCANYPGSGKDLYDMTSEFASRRYIVVLSGCSAMTAGFYRNEEGKTIYEMFSGDFDASGVVNVGSCVANSHIAGAAIKIANIFAKRSLRANYEEIADYTLNRIGAVGIAWGAMSQKAVAIAAGFWRLGVPVIVGPHGSKYKRMLLGRKEREEDWYVYDARTGDRTYVGPVPEHLFIAAETKEEAMVLTAKLCMRANDTTMGRSIKLTHYMDLHRRMYGSLPDDLHLLVRSEKDIPLTMRGEILEILKSKSWREHVIPDPTLLQRLVRGGKQ